MFLHPLRCNMRSWIYMILLVAICSPCMCHQNELKDVLHNNSKVRVKRGVFWDVFQKMFITKNLVVDQYVDTRNTINEVFNMLNEGFSDPAPSKPTLAPTGTPRTKSSTNTDDSGEVSSTTEPYRVSRYEFGRILGRNYRGLKRLTNIEFADAMNATKYNLQEYKMEADKQFANSLALEKKQKIKQLTG